jgi:hypothetical protein
MRVLLTQPIWQDQILEELGKLDADDLPTESPATEALEDEPPGVLRDEVFRAIHGAVQRHGADAAPEVFTDGLDPLTIHVYEELRGDKDAVVDARKSIDDAIRQLRARALDEQVSTLQSLLPLAEPGDKDQLNVRIKQLSDEKRALGVQHWGSVRARRGRGEV